MWGHLRQVIIWVVHEGPGWEGDLSNFSTPKKVNFSLWPQLWPGCWCAIKMVSCLGYPDMSPTTHKKPYVSSTSWGHTMKGQSWTPSAKTLDFSPGQPGPRRQEGALFQAPPASPYCLGRMWLHPPCLSFQGSVALPNTLSVATWRNGAISMKLTGDLSQGGGHLP